jgi:5-methylcytosine-specific restriction endonuclease McrA
MRMCRKCKVAKDESEFSANKAIKDGLDTMCKDCMKAKNAANYAKHQEKRVAYAAQYREENEEQVKARQRAYQEDHREERNQYLRDWRAAGNKANRPADYNEKRAEQARERYATDPDYRTQCLIASAEFKKANPEYYKIKNQEYRQNNLEDIRDYARDYNRNRRANDPEFYARTLEHQTMWRLRNWQKIQETKGWVKYVPGERITLVQFRELRGWQQDHCYFCNSFIGRDGELCTIDHIIPRALGGPDLRQNLVLSCGCNCNYSRQNKLYHIEWMPRREIEPIHGKFFLRSSSIGKKLTEAGLDWSRDGDGNWILKHGKGHERPLFIVSTFFGSDRNPASENGKICKLIQSQHEKPIILLDREWFARPESCLNMMRSKMGISDKGPGARKLDVIEVSQQDANTFLDSHHVMGKKDNVAIRLGLTDGSILHAVALFSDKGLNYEWDRLALKGHIAGGMSKLMKGLWERYGYKPIRSFVDSRYADGSGHETIGFQHMGMSGETYQWVFPDRIQHQRYLSNDNKMSQNLLYFDKDLSAADNIRANGVFKIWSPKKHVILIEK